MIKVQHYNNINIKEVGKTILRYLILSILPSPSSNNTYEDKTQNVTLTPLKITSIKVSFQKCQELQLLLKFSIKPLMPHDFIQCTKQKKKVLCYRFDTVQRHHSIYLTSKQKWHGSKHQPVGLTYSHWLIVIHNSMQFNEGMVTQGGV